MFVRILWIGMLMLLEMSLVLVSGWIVLDGGGLGLVVDVYRIRKFDCRISSGCL
jgi:hypothetical protein